MCLYLTIVIKLVGSRFNLHFNRSSQQWLTDCPAISFVCWHSVKEREWFVFNFHNPELPLLLLVVVLRVKPRVGLKNVAVQCRAWRKPLHHLDRIATSIEKPTTDFKVTYIGHLQWESQMTVSEWEPMNQRESLERQIYMDFGLLA